MGIWRARQKRFSAKWFIAIHAPVPLVILLRLLMGVSYYSIPLLILGSVSGQMVGGTERFNRLK
ncbi:MAG: hypothetical protein LBH05_01075 [Deferribacteraceae bacterium]|nr:hypothetical protein [Deferribacteraceae bacterium]